MIFLGRVRDIDGALVTAILLINIFFHQLSTGDASNWAQVNGARRQNVAKPRATKWTPRYGMAVVGTDYFRAPDPPATGWQSSIDDPDEIPYNDYQIFLLGGDDYDEEQHTGGYLNEVWSSPGAEWTTVEDLVRKEPRIVSKMQWTERGPLMEDKLPPSGVTYDEWTRCLVSNWPNAITAMCDKDLDVFNGGYRRWSPRRNLAGAYFKPGPNAHKDVQHRSRGLDIWVLGGRARAIEDIPVRESWGGVIPWGPDEVMKDKFDNPPRAYPTGPNAAGDPGDPFKNGPPFPDQSGSRNRICRSEEKVNPDTGEVNLVHYPCWREKTVLKNDVWAAPQNLQGEWTLVNPGCKYHEDGSLHMPGEPGVEGAKCTTSLDCYGNSNCVNENNEMVEDGLMGTCRCKHWLPRERHAVAVLNPLGADMATVVDPTLYLSGGIMRIQEQRCGKMMCGGGYRMWGNDVWSSIDGVTWNEISKPSFESRGGKYGERWAPRAGHVMIVMNNVLFILGGQGGDLNDKSEIEMYLSSKPGNMNDPDAPNELVIVRNESESPFFNDVWSSADGSLWTFNHTAPWAPRKDFVAGVECKRRLWPPNGGLPVCSGQRIIVSGGQTAEGIVGDTWWGNPAEGTDGWHVDFDNSTEDPDQRVIASYVDLDGPVEQIQTLSKAHIAALRSVGIFTVRGFAIADAETVEHLRGPKGSRTGWSNVCFHKRRAEALVNKCTVRSEYYPGYEDRPENAVFAVPSDEDPEYYNIETTTNPYPQFQLDGDGEDGEEEDDYAEDGLDGYGADGCEQATDPAFVLEALNDWKYQKADAERGDLKYYLATNQTTRNEWGNPVPTMEDTRTRLGLQCRWTPSNRTMAAGLVFRNKFYVFGGRQAKGITFPNFRPRTWVRTGSEGISIPGDDIRALPVGASGPHQGAESGDGYEPGVLLNDGWYRDDTIPEAKMAIRPEPRQGSEKVLFKFNSYDGPHEPQVPSENCIFEYAIWAANECCEGSEGDIETRAGEEDYDASVECYDTADPPACLGPKAGPDERTFGNPSTFGGDGSHTLLWPWSWTDKRVIISDRKEDVYPYSYREGPDAYIPEAKIRGMCHGRSALPNDENYCFASSNVRMSIRVRAIDPAGNMDYAFSENGNQYTWLYVHPLPIMEIVLAVFGVLIVLLAIYLQIRRRRRKKAMERYAMKRMRRKFKGMQSKCAT